MDPVYEAYLHEVKPGRAWAGQLSSIDKLLAWMYDKDILTKTDKDKKNSLFRQYYRFYNDGDWPRGLNSKGVSKYDPKEKIEAALEELIEDFMKMILLKYQGKYDRNEFRFDKFNSEMKDLVRMLNGDDISMIKYFGTKYTVPDNKFGEYLKKLLELQAEINAMMDPKIDELWPERNWESPHGKIYSYKKEALQGKKAWDSKMASLDKQIQMTKIEMEGIVKNLMTAADKARKLKLLG